MVVSWHTGSELIVPAGVVPHDEESLYLAFIVQHPGVFVSKLFIAEPPVFKLELYGLSAPPGACTAYSAVKPEIIGTAVISASLVLQVFAKGVNTGAAGNITTLTVLLLAHAPVPTLLAGVVPHAAVSTYLAAIE